MTVRGRCRIGPVRLPAKFSIGFKVLTLSPVKLPDELPKLSLGNWGSSSCEVAAEVTVS